MARTIERLLAARSVVTVSSRTKALGALRSLGVNPDASYDSEPLRTLHRTTKDSDYYFLFNSSTERTSTTVTLKGRGVPYRYNAWTGAVTRSLSTRAPAAASGCPSTWPPARAN